MKTTVSPTWAVWFLGRSMMLISDLGWFSETCYNSGDNWDSSRSLKRATIVGIIGTVLVL